MISAHAPLDLCSAQTARPSLYTRAKAAFAVWRQRRELANLTADRLSDLGLTADQARTEAAKPVWNVPAHWLR